MYSGIGYVKFVNNNMSASATLITMAQVGVASNAIQYLGISASGTGSFEIGFINNSVYTNYYTVDCRFICLETTVTGLSKTSTKFVDVTSMESLI